MGSAKWDLHAWAQRVRAAAAIRNPQQRCSRRRALACPSSTFTTPSTPSTRRHRSRLGVHSTQHVPIVVLKDNDLNYKVNLEASLARAVSSQVCAVCVIVHSTLRARAHSGAAPCGSLCGSAATYITLMCEPLHSTEKNRPRIRCAREGHSRKRLTVPSMTVMHCAAVAQLHNDAQWLGSHNIMDYSLLIGLPHHPVPIHRPPFPMHPLRRCLRAGALRINRPVALPRRAAPLLRDRESTRAAKCRVGTAFALAAPADALIDLCAPSCAGAALTATRLLGQAAPAGGVGPGWPVLDGVSFACPGQGHALVLQVGLWPTGRRRPALCGRVGCFDQGECAERLSQRLLV